MTVAGTTQPGVANVLINAHDAQVDADGDYVLENLDVTTPLLPHQGDGRTRDIITAVNTNMESQSILWEKVRLAPRVTEPTYDLAGNMTSDGRISYTWNAANQLISCEDEDFHIDFHAILRRRTEYVYDAESRRIEKRDYARTVGGSWELFATTQYLYDGWEIVAAHVTTGNVTTTHMYVHGIDISGTMGGAGGVGGLLMGAHRTTGDTLVREQYIYDSQGNVRHKVRVGAGAPSISATYEYDPYGRLLYADPPPAYEVAPQFLFSTKLYESHWQQYYYGYRYYSPDTGRWHSRDPIGERGGINLYGFVGNNPLMFVDVYGLRSNYLSPVTGNYILWPTEYMTTEEIIEWCRRAYFAKNEDGEYTGGANPDRRKGTREFLRSIYTETYYTVADTDFHKAINRSREWVHYPTLLTEIGIIGQKTPEGGSYQGREYNYFYMGALTAHDNINYPVALAGVYFWKVVEWREFPPSRGTRRMFREGRKHSQRVTQ